MSCSKVRMFNRLSRLGSALGQTRFDRKMMDRSFSGSAQKNVSV